MLTSSQEKQIITQIKGVRKCSRNVNNFVVGGSYANSYLKYYVYSIDSCRISEYTTDLYKISILNFDQNKPNVLEIWDGIK
jgi:hypothetical protein